MTYDPTPIDEAYAWCRRITHEHGANFSVGFRFLPLAKRDAVYAAYAFCRWADDIADDAGEGIGARLDAWEEELERCYSGSAGHRISIALADALQRFAIPKSAFAALIAGCRQDIVKNRYQTFEELVDYCDLVATSISDISLAIFGYRGDDTPAIGRNLSTALQLTNITRDIGDDLDRNRIYLPLAELDRFGVSEEELARRSETRGVRRLIEFQIERAESYFAAAEPLLQRLDTDARYPTLLMGSVYATVLRKVAKDPFAALHRRVALTRSEKLRVVASRLIHRHFL
ncbi:MAG TPA: squalene/phytoene synthase family protein [Thermoanaerobaculia bacterium]|nr:squalene/phytoene synthase family protein [Thermoanaerobaculia bacterium]